jgi:diaminopimelate decarboxylase
MKRPFVSKEKLDEIIAKYPTPFHLYDERGIRENARRLQKAFSWNRGFKEYFAVKATPNPVILEILKEENCGVDCSSLTELILSEACGFSGTEIMFSSNATPKCEFVCAHRLGAIINLDDFTHIDFLEGCAGIPETICCRFNPGGNFVLQNRIMDKPGESKYGFTKEQLREGFLRLREKGAKRFGLHAFLASNTLTGEYYPALARLLFKTAAWLKSETGIETSFVNLSGGIGVPYRPEDEPNDILAIGASVEKAFNEEMVPAGMGDAALYTELGRFMLAPYGCLVATVLHEKKTYKNFLGLDACAVNLMRPAMYGAYHHITVSGKEDEPEDRLYDVTGSLCENNDKFAIDRKLPKVEIGDRLIIHDTGAHGFSMGYNYNGRLKSAELLLREDGSVELIRRPETAEDYFATLDVTGVFDGFDVGAKVKEAGCERNNDGNDNEEKAFRI